MRSPTACAQGNISNPSKLRKALHSITLPASAMKCACSFRSFVCPSGRRHFFYFAHSVKKNDRRPCVAFPVCLLCPVACLSSPHFRPLALLNLVALLWAASFYFLWGRRRWFRAVSIYWQLSPAPAPARPPARHSRSSNRRLGSRYPPRFTLLSLMPGVIKSSILLNAPACFAGLFRTP